MSVLVNKSPLGLWQDVIHQAQAGCSIILPEDIELYLVLLLMRYMDKPELSHKIIASSLLEGLNTRAHRRDAVLQEVGDACLLFSGLFPGVAEKRLVKIGYFINIGRGAYIAVSRTSNDIYSLLAQQFVSIMDILQSIRQYSQNHPDLLPLQAYELWNESGSQRALAMLKHYTQATPVNLFTVDRDACLIKIKSTKN